MLSKKTKYAIKALVRLAREHDTGNMLLIGQIAASERIPKKFLEAILLELKNAGILSSKKGKGGGYYLAKKPADVNLARVIRMFNGPIAMLPCVSLNYYERCDECIDETICGLRRVALEVRDATLKILINHTLADYMKIEDDLSKLKKAPEA